MTINETRRAQIDNPRRRLELLAPSVCLPLVCHSIVNACRAIKLRAYPQDLSCLLRTITIAPRDRDIERSRVRYARRIFRRISPLSNGIERNGKTAPGACYYFQLQLTARPCFRIIERITSGREIAATGEKFSARHRAPLI